MTSLGISSVQMLTGGAGFWQLSFPMNIVCIPSGHNLSPSAGPSVRHNWIEALLTFTTSVYSTGIERDASGSYKLRRRYFRLSFFSHMAESIMEQVACLEQEYRANWSLDALQSRIALYDEVNIHSGRYSSQKRGPSLALPLLSL